MLNETNSELQERSDKAAIEEMMIRTEEPQIPARIYTGELEDALDLMYDDYMDQLIAEQIQEIEARDWNDRHGY